MAHSRNDLIREGVEREVDHNAAYVSIAGIGSRVMKDEDIVDLVMSHVDPLVAEIAELERKLRMIKNMAETAEESIETGADYYYHPVISVEHLRRRKLI